MTLDCVIEAVRNSILWDRRIEVQVMEVNSATVRVHTLVVVVAAKTNLHGLVRVDILGK